MHMMVEPTFLFEKIPDQELRQMAIDGSEEKVSVIIVLDLPEPRVEVEQVKKGSEVISVPTSLEPESPDEEQEVARKASEANLFLQSLTGSVPNWLPMARAFVVTVNGKQLREIADSPITKSIQPNRELK